MVRAATVAVLLALSTSASAQLDQSDFRKAKAYAATCKLDYEALADPAKLRERAKAHDFNGLNLSPSERREYLMLCVAYASGRFDQVYSKNK